MTQTVVVLTSGSSWTRPSDCPDVLDLVECWGGGGPGHSNTSIGTGAGGGGAYAAKPNYSIGAQTSIAIQIPGSTTAGSSPIDTWFDSATTGILADSGLNATNTSGAAGGQAANCIGDIAYSGGNGSAYSVLFNCGSGGGAATKNGAGVSAVTTTGGDAGTGGGTHGSPPADNVEGAGGADGRSYINSGYSGGAPGGGGAGGYTGGSGGRGQIRITYTPITPNVVLMMCEA